MRAWLVLAISIAGCGGDDGPSAVDAATDTSSDADARAGDGGSDADAVSDVDVPPGDDVCSMTFMDPSAACGSGACPVSVNAHAACRDGVYQLSVAATAATKGYFAFLEQAGGTPRGYVYVGRVDGPARSAVERHPSEAWHIAVTQDGNAGPFLAAVLDDRIEAFEGDLGSWTAQTITTGTEAAYRTRAATSGTTVHVLAAHETDPLVLATRMSGTWSEATVADVLPGYMTVPVAYIDSTDLALDPAGVPSVVRWEVEDTTARIVVGGLDATPTTLMETMVNSAGGGLRLAMSDAGPIVLLQTGSLFLFGSGTEATSVIATSGFTNPECREETGTGGACEGPADTSTDVYYVQRGASDLERTADGAVWFAYAGRHVACDFHAMTGASEAGPNCTRQVTADRSSTELVLFRVTPGNPPTIEERYRGPLLDGNVTELALSSFERTLHVAAAVGTSGTTVQYLVIDTSAL